MAEKMLKVFIGSTYRDLKEVRNLLIGDIGEKLEAVAMEKFIPVHESSHKESLDHLTESDVCIFIIGDYYGTLIGGCKRRVAACDCDSDISFTHCEYRRAVQMGKPRILYIVHHELTDVLSGIHKFTLKTTEKNEVLKFLDENKKDISKADVFSGYSLQEIRELWEIANHENKELVKEFKEEVERVDEFMCHSPVYISSKRDYYTFHKKVKMDLKEAVSRWYNEGKIRFKAFAGRRNDLKKLLEKLHGNSVCVVGTGGVGKTSLIQVGLLLEGLSGRKIYAALKEYPYKYTRAGYRPAKNKFIESTFSDQLTLTDVITLVFENDVRLDHIKKMDTKEQASLLREELDREGSILFVDDLQDATDDVKEFVFSCGNNLVTGAVVAGAREKGNCYSSVGPLTGLQGEDLKEIITIVGEGQSSGIRKEDLDSWSDQIFRITQGHPLLVDIMVKNAPHFSNYDELKKIRGVKSVTDQKTVNEVMGRLIRDILTDEEQKLIGILSIFPLPVDKLFVDIIGEEEVNSIIDKWLLRRDQGRLVFTFEAVRELLEAEVPKEVHEVAVMFYSKGLEVVDERDKPRLYVEIVYHLLKRGKFEEALRLYSSISGNLERTRNRAVVVSEMLLKNTKEKEEKAFILGTLGNLLLMGKEFSGAREDYTGALEIYRALAQEDPGGYQPNIATSLDNLGNLYYGLRDFKRAEESYTEALEIYRALAQENPGAYQSDLAMTLNNLGALYSDLRDFKRAEESYTEALEYKNSLPDNGARTYLGMAVLEEKMQKDDAHQLYFTAGVTSLNVYLAYGLQSINFLHCFKKTQELSPTEAPLNRMAQIAVTSISKIRNTHQPTSKLAHLNTDDLPEICRALVTLLVKGKVTQVKDPENDIEFMFYCLYQLVKNNQRIHQD